MRALPGLKPDRATAAGVAAGAAGCAAMGLRLGPSPVLPAFCYPAGIGWGDVKLSGVLGLYLGWCGARTFATGLAGGFVLAAVFGVALIVAGRASRKTQIPFGPFMLAGAVAAILALGGVGS